jgi:hypothetical protein
MARLIAPSMADDPGFVAWLARLHRQTYSPGAALAAARMTLETDLRQLLPTFGCRRSCSVGLGTKSLAGPRSLPRGAHPGGQGSSGSGRRQPDVCRRE